MKNLIVFLLLTVFGGYLVFLASCGSDDEFEDENFFNLDTLYVSPPAIGNSFSVTWEVTTIGFPQFFIDIYLSDDEILDANDLIIAKDAADTDTSTPDIPYTNRLLFRITEPTGGTGNLFEYSFDDTDWEGDALTQENLSGKTKYIIGRFYHLSGLQIEVDRTRMAVEVEFQ